jgi:HSP20 family molecular chaperone IbpA
MIEVAAPGRRREDFQVELDNNVLIISSQREDKREGKRITTVTIRAWNSVIRHFSAPSRYHKTARKPMRSVPAILMVILEPYYAWK